MNTRSRKTFFALILMSCALLAGAAVGLGIFTFVYAKGASYFSDKPEACANCHAMREVLHDWRAGGHHHVAVCNDCHVPANPVGKWIAKGINGVHHSYAFTVGHIPEVIQAGNFTKDVVEKNCLRCHSTLFPDHGGGARALRCSKCHGEVGHFN